MRFTLLVAALITGLISFSLSFQSNLMAQGTSLALDAAGWAGIHAYPVTGRTGILVKQKMEFGGYRTSRVERSWTTGTSATAGLTRGIPTDQDYRKIITTDYIRKKQTLWFAMEDSTGLHAEAYCASRFSAEDFNIGNSPVSAVNLFGDLMGVGVNSSSYFYVQIYLDGSAPWHLILDNEAAQRNPRTYTTRLARSADDYYSIRPDYRVKGKKGKIGNMPFGSAGFQFLDRHGNPVAAVSLMEKGVVYLMDLPPAERLLLSAAAAALLLQEQI